MTSAVVTAVSRSEAHTFSKRSEPRIQLISGVGVEGDVHAGGEVRPGDVIDVVLPPLPGRSLQLV
jgi:hypothetical protein